MAENPATNQNEQIKTPEIGPPGISFTTFLLKMLAGGAGGMIGTLVLLLVVVLTQSILPTPEELNEYISPIFIFLISVMVFLSSTIGNILSVFLLSLTEGTKYSNRSSTIYQVFIVSVIIFLLMVPVYFITSSINIQATAFAVALHVIITAQVSALILEIISNYRYALLGVYGVTFSTLISAGILFGLMNITTEPAILLFAALPVVWGSIGFTYSIVTMLYGWFARVYDKDFLATDTLYGRDYGNDEEDEEEEPRAQDEQGADFLRHNK